MLSYRTITDHHGPYQVASNSRSPTTREITTMDVSMQQHDEAISQLSNSLCDHVFNATSDVEPQFYNFTTLHNRYLTFYVADDVQCNGRRQISLYANYITPSYSNENRQPHALQLFRRGEGFVDPRDNRAITFTTIRDWIKILLGNHAHPLYVSPRPG